MKADLINKLKKIKVLAMDVDGVMTNGEIIYDYAGNELKIFNVQDGHGISMIRKAGIKTAVISARSAGAVTARVTDLKIDKVYLDAYPKIGAYEKLLEELGVKDDEVCFMGDDLPDLCILERVGLPVSVANAAAEVKKYSIYTTKKEGGYGAVREIAELILKTQGKWKGV